MVRASTEEEEEETIIHRINLYHFSPIRFTQIYIIFFCGKQLTVNSNFLTLFRLHAGGDGYLISLAKDDYGKEIGI